MFTFNFKIKKRAVTDKNFVYSYNMPEEILINPKKSTLKTTDKSPFKIWKANKNNKKDDLTLKHDIFSNSINSDKNDQPFKLKTKKSIKISCCEVS